MRFSRREGGAIPICMRFHYHDVGKSSPITPPSPYVQPTRTLISIVCIFVLLVALKLEPSLHTLLLATWTLIGLPPSVIHASWITFLSPIWHIRSLFNYTFRICLLTYLIKKLKYNAK